MIIDALWWAVGIITVAGLAALIAIALLARHVRRRARSNRFDWGCWR